MNEKHRKVNRQSDELIATFTEWIQKIKENLLSKQEIEKLAPKFWDVFMMYLEKQLIAQHVRLRRYVVFGTQYDFRK